MSYSIRLETKTGQWALPYEEYKDFAFVLASFISAPPYLGKLSDMSEIDWAECLEARFFSRDRELHVWPEEDGLHTALTWDEEAGQETGMEQLTRRFVLRRIAGGGKLLVREYFGYDEDGQLFVEKTRLAGIERRDE